jgi:hypothetical protein
VGELDRNKPHIFASGAETGFLLIKEQVPFILKNKISAI